MSLASRKAFKCPSHYSDFLSSKSDDRWAEIAVDGFEQTLCDHAHCEKKASSQALALINDYPDDVSLVSALCALAKEELFHFEEIYQLLQRRGLKLGYDRGDPYVKALMQEIRQPAPERKLDRLLVSALVEARSCERFRLLKQEFQRRENPEEAERFGRFELSEAGHAKLFFDFAFQEFGEQAYERLIVLSKREALIVEELPLLPRIH